MIVARFKAECKPEHVEEMAAAIAAVEPPTRLLPGVVHFDVARSLTEPTSFVVTEVFEDRGALDRQNAQPEVAAMIRLIEAGALVREMEWNVWEAEPAD
jgi:quinol monooxygenase YgiN